MEELSRALSADHTTLVCAADTLGDCLFEEVIARDLPESRAGKAFSSPLGGSFKKGTGPRCVQPAPKNFSAVLPGFSPALIRPVSLARHVVPVGVPAEAGAAPASPAWKSTPPYVCRKPWIPAPSCG